MANEMTLFIILAVAAASPAAALSSQDLGAAIEEMQRANYFTFVLLINLSQKITTENVTFLMPKDKVLSGTKTLQQESVSDFLLRHSIPSALLFEHLGRFPSGSWIPSCSPDYMLRISNGGRKSFFLNNVRIISPNLCTATSSIRCHGIDGVLNLLPVADNNNNCNLSSTASPPSTAPAFPNHAPRLAPEQPSDHSGTTQKSSAGSNFLGITVHVFAWMVLTSSYPL